MLTIKKCFLVFAVLLISLAPSAYAHCPICTAAVGAAAISAKYYGLDTTIIGLLIGAFGISTGLWAGLKMKKYFKLQLPIIVIASFLLTVVPLLYMSSDSIYFPLLLFGKAGSLLNKVYWIDKMLFGSMMGAFATLAAFWLHLHVKKLNGKVLFPFQGVIITFAMLLVSGLGLYLYFGG